MIRAAASPAEARPPSASSASPTSTSDSNGWARCRATGAAASERALARMGGSAELVARAAASTNPASTKPGTNERTTESCNDAGPAAGDTRCATAVVAR